MGDFLKQNWMELVSLVVSVLAFLRAGSAERRAKRAFEESHEIQWAVHWSPIAGPRTDMDAVRLEFKNTSKVTVASRAWIDPVEISPFMPFESDGGFNVRPNESFGFGSEMHRQLPLVPDQVTVYWIPKMSVLKRIRCRLASLFDESDGLIREQVVLLHDVKKEMSDEASRIRKS